MIRNWRHNANGLEDEKQREPHTSSGIDMIFAKRVFYWSGIYGILVLLPMFFLEHQLGIYFPPATNHPEQYYAFIGVALVWQFYCSG
jgi:hypothetical protein